MKYWLAGLLTLLVGCKDTDQQSLALTVPFSTPENTQIVPFLPAVTEVPEETRILPFLPAVTKQERWQANALRYREDMTKSAWGVFGLRAPLPLLAAQIHQESLWNTAAVSKAYTPARGISQFTDPTSSDMAKWYPEICSPANPHDPIWGFNCRDLYMKRLMASVSNEFTSVCSEWAFTLRAYNGGLGWINRERKLTMLADQDHNDWVVIAKFNAGRSAANFKENTEYPVRIFRLQDRYAEWGDTLACL